MKRKLFFSQNRSSVYHSGDNSDVSPTKRVQNIFSYICTWLILPVGITGSANLTKSRGAIAGICAFKVQQLGVQFLAQGHFETVSGGARNQISYLLITGRPLISRALPAVESNS